MGGEQLARSEPEDITGAGIRRALLPGARGECLEDDSDGIKLHLGCGKKHWNGWVNVDIADNSPVQSDLRKLPFSDGYADKAAAIHVLEHFYFWDAEIVLSEWMRVLKPGGLLILELPCMDKIIHYMAMRLAEKSDIGMQMTWYAFWGDPKHKSVDMCHKWGYTKMQIVKMLKQVGFSDVRVESPRYHLAERDMRITAVKP